MVFISLCFLGYLLLDLEAATFRADGADFVACVLSAFRLRFERGDQAGGHRVFGESDQGMTSGPAHTQTKCASSQRQNEALYPKLLHNPPSARTKCSANAKLTLPADAPGQ